MKQAVIVLIALALFVLGINTVNRGIAKNAVNTNTLQRTVILDAGHGGEDGGAVAADGTVEKDINLAITGDIAGLFDFLGVRYVTVRDEDKAVGDETLETVRKRKYSDILSRYNLVNSYENSVLLSIHQNYYDNPKYGGAQVFYSSSCDDSRILAQNIQDCIRTVLQPENERDIKASGSSVYLLYKAQTTSVMVECGFLSNKDELEKLKTDIYRKQISLCICKGLIDFLNNNDNI